MDLLFTGVPSNDVLQAVCRTLIHSLWQGLIAAAVAALIVTFTKRSAASIRYNLLIAVLCLFVLSISVTAIRQLLSASKKEGVAATTQSKINFSLHPNSDRNEVLVTTGATQGNLTDRFSTYCNEHAPMIVLIWFLLFIIKCTQLITGLCYIRRLRCSNNYGVSFYWKDRLLQLAKKTGVTRTILFLESELVKVPAVIGFLKPMLLVPAGLLSQLPPEQVEAILLHELAHIRRRDFLVNLLQSFIEAFFFFNPAIVWISSLIREEREACCDDMVLAHIPQKTSYLQALVSFQDLQFHSKIRAMALTGNRHYLLNRVRRMLTLENKKLNLMEKTVLLLSIVGITAFGFIIKETKENPVPLVVAKKETLLPASREMKVIGSGPLTKKPEVKKKKLVAISVAKPKLDTLPKTTTKQNTERSFPSISSNTSNNGNSIVSQIEATDNEGKHYRIKRIDGQVTELSVNGTTIPQNRFGEYSEVIKQIDETQRQRILKKKEDYQLRKVDADARLKEILQKKMEARKAEQKERTEKMKLRNELAKKDNLKRVEERKLFEKKNELRKIEYSQMKAEAIQKEKFFNQKKAEVVQKQKMVTQERKGNDDVSRIISDLNNRKLVSDGDNLSFSLTNTELIVNGSKQPAEIHQQFKEKYIQNSSDHFNYSRKGNTTSITISRE
jgi:beta-lactamase regulating signal transducer with metallopeptidase domain